MAGRPESNLSTRVEVTIAAQRLVEAKKTSPDHHAQSMVNLVEILANKPGAITALREIHGEI